MLVTEASYCPHKLDYTTSRLSCSNIARSFWPVFENRHRHIQERSSWRRIRILLRILEAIDPGMKLVDLVFVVLRNADRRKGHYK